MDRKNVWPVKVNGKVARHNFSPLYFVKLSTEVIILQGNMKNRNVDILMVDTNIRIFIYLRGVLVSFPVLSYERTLIARSLLRAFDCSLQVEDLSIFNSQRSRLPTPETTVYFSVERLKLAANESIWSAHGSFRLLWRQLVSVWAHVLTCTGLL